MPVRTFSVPLFEAVGEKVIIRESEFVKKTRKINGIDFKFFFFFLIGDVKQYSNKIIFLLTKKSTSDIVTQYSAESFCTHLGDYIFEVQI